LVPQVLDDEQVGARGGALDTRVKARDRAVGQDEALGTGGDRRGDGPPPDFQDQSLHLDQARRPQALQGVAAAHQHQRAGARVLPDETPPWLRLAEMVFLFFARHRDSILRLARPGATQPAPVARKRRWPQASYARSFCRYKPR
jgi:hypothetical protein